MTGHEAGSRAEADFSSAYSRPARAKFVRDSIQAEFRHHDLLMGTPAIAIEKCLPRHIPDWVYL